MEVFLSWSGARSEAVAQALFEWLPLVLQPVKPWLSRAIEKGSRWEDVISERLEMSNFGIICLTPESLKSEWLLFEAGALSKKAREARVCTYLYALRESDVAGPLAKFQHTRADRDDTKQLVKTLNQHLGAAQLDGQRLEQTFEHWWPDLEQRLQNVRDIEHPKTAKRDPASKLDEILVEVRSLSRSFDQLRTRGTTKRQALRFAERESMHVVKRWTEFRKQIVAAFLERGVEILHEGRGDSTRDDSAKLFDIIVLSNGSRIGIDVHIATQLRRLQGFPEFAGRHALLMGRALRTGVCDVIFLASDKALTKEPAIRDLALLASEMAFRERLRFVHGTAEMIASSICAVDHQTPASLE